MSTVIVIAPIVITSWPLIATAVTAAVASMGFAVAKEAAVAGEVNDSTTLREEIEVEDTEILADSASVGGEEMVVEREGLRAVFRRDARGALRVCVEGKGYTKEQLRQIGEEMIGRVTQQYAYHRLVSEMKDKNMTIVDEEVLEDSTVKIRVRNW